MFGGNGQATGSDRAGHRASGLNLVVASIVLWNTVYLERAVTAIRRNGQNGRQTILTETARPSLHFTVDSPCARMTLVNVRGRTVLVPCRD